MNWKPFDKGKSIGKIGSEKGVIIKDEELQDSARITLAENCETAPFAISCGVYGGMVHTRFCNSKDEALRYFELTKNALGDIVTSLPIQNGPESKNALQTITEKISSFVDRFP
jgi:hypothetical protein